MFDLIVASTNRPLRERSPTSKASAIAVHVAVVALVVGASVVRVANRLPSVPTVWAFTAPPPFPTSPPPPPPSSRALKPRASPSSSHETPAAPMEPPPNSTAEATTGNASARDDVDGVSDRSVDGGIPTGTAGGLVGGFGPPVPVPPLRPTTPSPQAPVRITGQMAAPMLLHRVEPVYPAAASFVHLSGVVVLEVVVDAQGRVDSVKVLRSRHPLLDNAAIEALKQWRYSPLVLNGRTTPFILSVTFTFDAGAGD